MILILPLFRQIVFTILLFSSQHILAGVPSYYQRVGTESHIPAPLLYAIAIQESRPPSGAINGVQRPWPWTLNCAGKGYYLATRQVALNVATAHIEKGESCDIGLMQISWAWHKNQFVSLNDALDPLTNLRVGAQLLHSLYKKSGSWDYAVGAYHSPSNRIRAQHYKDKVVMHLTHIIQVQF